MSSRSRRRTLSHVEIENFLNVIGSDSEVSLPTKAHKRRSSIIFEKDFDENRVNNASSDKIQAHHDIKSSNSQAVLQKNSTFKPIVENRNAELTDVELIRKYCKIRARGVGSHLDKVSIAKTVAQLTTYDLMPKRALYPESFEHSSSSLEGKKALLLSLGPSLKDAEEKRKSDADTIEAFTRCRVTRSKSKSITYEYFDIDIDRFIPGEDYEKRYLLYLKSRRVNNDDQFLSALEFFADTPFSMIEDYELTGPTEEAVVNVPPSSDIDQNFCFDFSESPQVKGQSKKSRDRRITLSPASARAAIMNFESRRESMDFLIPLPADEIVDVESEISTLPLLIDDFTLPAEDQTMTEDDKIVDSFAGEIDALLSSSESCLNCYGSQQLRGDVFSMDVENATPPLPETSDMHGSDSVNILQEEDSTKIVLSAEEALLVAEAHAHARLRLRFDQARWKYHWEVASSHASQKARSLQEKFYS